MKQQFKRNRKSWKRYALNVDCNRLLPQMSDLMHGEAALWFRNNHHVWKIVKYREI